MLSSEQSEAPKCYVSSEASDTIQAKNQDNEVFKTKIHKLQCEVLNDTCFSDAMKTLLLEDISSGSTGNFRFFHQTAGGWTIKMRAVRESLRQVQHDKFIEIKNKLVLASAVRADSAYHDLVKAYLLKDIEEGRVNSFKCFQLCPDGWRVNVQLAIDGCGGGLELQAHFLLTKIKQDPNVCMSLQKVLFDDIQSGRNEFVSKLPDGSGFCLNKEMAKHRVLSTQRTCNLCHVNHDKHDHKPYNMQPCGHSCCLACLHNEGRMALGVEQGSYGLCLQCSQPVLGIDINASLLCILEELAPAQLQEGESKLQQRLTQGGLPFSPLPSAAPRERIEPEKRRASEPDLFSLFYSDEECDQENSLSPYHCPIMLTVMKQPMVLQCGHSFEKKAIDEWFGNSMKLNCPFRCKLRNNSAVQNLHLREAIQVAVVARDKKRSKRTSALPLASASHPDGGYPELYSLNFTGIQRPLIPQ